MGPKQDESIPSVPGLEVTGPNVLECGARPTGDCAGSNDFRCAFDALARATIDLCFQATGCTADGWVAISLGDDGCLSDIRMKSVDQPFVDCLIMEVDPVSCPCNANEYATFLGLETMAAESTLSLV